MIWATLLPMVLWDFSSSNHGFESSGGTGQWEHGPPAAGPPTTEAVWGTRLSGLYLNDTEDLLAASLPDLSTTDRPILQFSHWYDILPGDLGTVQVEGPDGWRTVEPVYGYPALQGGYVGGTSDFLTEAVELEIDDTAIRFVLEADENLSSNGWYVEWAAVYDGDKGHTQLYLNGVLDATVCGAPGRRRVNTRPVLMGARETKADGLNGLINDVRVYTRALSDEEIAAFVRGAKVNEPPEVDAGPNLEVGPERTIVLRGSFEDDGRGTAAISQWHRWVGVAGPSDVIIDNPYSLETTAIFSTPGAYLIELKGSDGGHTTYDTLNVTVK